MEKNQLQHKELCDFIVHELEELKARDIQVLDVTKLTDIADYMVIASGTSSRHLKSVSANLLQKAKEEGIQALGVEGGDNSDWILADLGDAIVHIMLPETRDFYQLEKLWSAPEETSEKP